MDSTRDACHANDQGVDENTLDNGELRRMPVEKNDSDENLPKSLIMEIYPWISQFKKMCRNSLEERTMSSLRTLMTFYVRNVRPSVNECRTKPLRAEKLKDTINETLLFFLYYYRDVDETREDRDYYLTVMSDLLAMYIDMELKASKKGKEHSSKISARLSSCLHVYLESSAEYLLDTLLKVHFMTNNYHDILDPVVTKIFKVINDHPSSSIMYVRYFLAYRLWKKLNKDVAVRNHINVIALSSLGEAPNDFPAFIVKSVLPQVPQSQSLSTRLILVQKFDLEKSCEEFLKFCCQERVPKLPKAADETSSTSMIAIPPEENDNCGDLITNNKKNSDPTGCVTPPIANISVNESSLASSIGRPSVSRIPNASSLSSVSLRRSNKLKDIVYIDLTSETITEKVIRSKKTRRKLSWLERAKKCVNSKIIAKNKTTEETTSDHEDSLDLRSLLISDPIPPPKMDQSAVEEDNEKTTANSETSKDVSSLEMIDDTSCIVTNGCIDKLPRDFECRQLECASEKNSRDRVEVDEKEVADKKIDGQVEQSLVEVSPSQVEASCPATDSQLPDQYSRSIKVADTREFPLEEERENGDEADTASEKLRLTYECLNDERLSDSNVTSIHLTIKDKDTNVQASEIINEVAISSAMDVQVAECPSDLSSTCNERKEPRKVREVEFQDNIDGLSLLASVSQRISDLTTTTTTINPVELIKVKNYASLVNPVAKESKPSDAPSYPEGTCLPEMIMDIYPEEAMDKVAYQVEITSTEDDYQPSDQQDHTNFPNDEITRCIPQASVDSPTNLVEKQDDANVILNGETIVLFQKSPNSNLYIINKAVENRDHVADEIMNLHRDMSDHLNDTVTFPYDIYDSVYRSQAPSFEISQYNRELASQESRRGKILKPEQSGDSVKSCDPLEASKSDAIDERSRIKRSLTNSGITRRRIIKQEYDDCTSNIAVKSSYVMQDCPSEHPDPSHSIHIPVAHTTSMYTKYPSATELYIPCHKSCNSITCGIPVNPSAPLHGGKNSGGNSRCSCLNCTYGIVAHCTECIIPNGEKRSASIESNSYYVPIHSGQSSSVQERKATSVDETLAKIYDDQLARKYEQKILEGKAMENVKYEPKENYRAELDNKLPLKKRFKAIMAMSFVEDLPIKYENMQNYPSTPMLSIAALETDQDNANKSDDSASSCNKSTLDLSSKNRTDLNSQTREMIRRDYRKEITMMSPPPAPTIPVPLQNSHRNASAAKRKRANSHNSPTERKEHEINYDSMRKGIGCKRATNAPTKASRLADNRKANEETESNTKQTKLTRKTRSSKRNVPKVNYIYTDGDSDWNPSGGVNGNSLNKRKRKRTSR